MGELVLGWRAEPSSIPACWLEGVGGVGGAGITGKTQDDWELDTHTNARQMFQAFQRIKVSVAFLILPYPISIPFSVHTLPGIAKIAAKRCLQHTLQSPYNMWSCIYSLSANSVLKTHGKPVMPECYD